jgi:pimeloyl-ACP methyl ester carboxylesterase
MTGTLALLFPALLAAPSGPDTRFAQLAPAYREGAAVRRSVAQPRAVLLVHGLRLHPFSGRGAARADWHSWQRPDSLLVRTLAVEADVFAFAYSQDVPLETIAEARALHEGVWRLRELGYREIVLVGHSAGGLVARQFAEDYPQAGVTRVIQVCAPNGGSGWARARMAVRKNQGPFLTSLTRKDRQEALRERAEKRIPADVEFVCVVGLRSIPLLAPGEPRANGARGVLPPGDGLVSAACQWTPDLQEQGIPAVPLAAGHSSVLHTQEGIDTIARLVRQRIGRWDEVAVAAARVRILGEAQKRP